MGIQFTGLASGIDTQSIIQDLMKVEYTKVEKVEKQKQMVEWEREAWEDMNTQLYDFYKSDLFKFKSDGTYNQKTVASSNTSLILPNQSASTSAVRGTHTITVNNMAQGSFLTGEELDGATEATTASDLIGALGNPLITFETDEIKTITISLDNGATSFDVDIEADDNIASIIEKINDLDLDLNVSFDEEYGRFFLSSTTTGEGVQIALGGDTGMLDALGFSNVTGTAGENSEFEYNGTTLTSDSNEITVNGLSFNLLGEGETVTITVSQDTESIYNSVKDFILKYNELMMNINEKIGADDASDYEPLTDDEKAAMTDDEILLWESTIKNSILRRDDTLTSLGRTLRSTLTLASGVDTSGMTYKSLSALGIVTSTYTEQGLLHIEGDEDETLLGVKENKLRAAIDDDPEAVMELLTALGNQLYSSFQTKMQSTSLSSALTFYNDKYMDTQIDDYEDKIYDLQDRMDEIEARYYKQFTAMEQAIQASNSTGDWLSQQLAGLN